MNTHIYVDMVFVWFFLNPLLSQVLKIKQKLPSLFLLYACLIYVLTMLSLHQLFFIRVLVVSPGVIAGK